jgi:hypothetical protein
MGCLLSGGVRPADFSHIVRLSNSNAIPIPFSKLSLNQAAAKSRDL